MWLEEETNAYHHRGFLNYRMLYFFHQQTAAISHGLTKEKQVPEREIELALRHRKLFEKDPAKYTYKEPNNG